jgi:hypothetical protein
MEENETDVNNIYGAQVFGSEFAKDLCRMAVVAAKGVHTFALQAIREAVPTFCVASLSELRFALHQQEPGQVIALDIRDVSLEDVAILGPCLAEAQASRGLVYILSEEQFALFENVQFDFVQK